MSIENDKMQKAIRNNMIQFLLTICKSNPELEFVCDHSFTRVRSDVPHPMLNRVLKTEGVPYNELQEFVLNTVDLYKQKSLPLMWLNWSINESPELVSILNDSGFEKVGSMPGMAMEIKGIAYDKNETPGFEIKSVFDENDFGSFIETITSSFSLPDLLVKSIQKQFANIGFNESSPIRHYIGYLNGVPVSTVTSFRHGDTIGIYNVAAVENVRGRGIGRMMTMHPLLIEKEKGCSAAILHSSVLGYNLYKEIGFKDYVDIDLYLLR